MNESGNSSAIREAAEKLVGYLPKFLDAIDYYGIDGYYRSCYKKDLKELHGRMDFLKSALAAPPRTCDRVADAEHGNDSAMRKALVQCELFLGYVDRHAHPTLNPGDKCVACEGVEELRGMVNAALAAPTRNCDVGTPAEQSRRFQEFCHLISTHSCDCSDDCPLIDEPDIVHCELTWAQMPYTEEGEDKC